MIQNRAARHYTDEEIELLETVAMVLAELIAGGELVAPEGVASRRRHRHPAAPVAGLEA